MRHLEDIDRHQLAAVTTLVLDFDGTLTDGRVTINHMGYESVICSRRDGHGIAMARAAGINVVVLSHVPSSPCIERCKALGVRFVFTDDKAAWLRDNLSFEERATTLFAGDDLPDIDAMRVVGLSVAPLDAVEAVQRVATAITYERGGDHCVRAIIDAILGARR